MPSIVERSSLLLKVQVEGDAVKIPGKVLPQLLQQVPTLENLLSRFARLQMQQAQQIAACNTLHRIEERLPTWILMIHDRIIPGDFLPLTHEMLSEIFGARRVTITVAANTIQKAGLIHYRRGSLQILNRVKLTETACEC